MQNFRSTERWRGGGAVVLRLADSAPRELEAGLVDVSAEGIGLKTMEPVALGAVVEVLMAPDDESVKRPTRLAHRAPEPLPLGTGRVVRAVADDAGEGYVCGICFDDCDPDRLEALMESLKNRSLGYAGQI
jgi:hypothetical protein